MFLSDEVLRYKLAYCKNISTLQLFQKFFLLKTIFYCSWDFIGKKILEAFLKYFEYYSIKKWSQGQRGKMLQYKNS